jgi:membrane glycosyltransferase
MWKPMASSSLTSPVSAPFAAMSNAPRATAVFVVLTFVLACAVLVAFALSIGAWTPMALAALPLLATSAVWIAGGAATSLIGLFRAQPPEPPVPGRLPSGKTAILLTLCREDPAPVAAYLAGLRGRLDRAGSGTCMQIFVLSDTSGEAEAAAEEALFRPLAEAGVLTYRRRAVNSGRKPGNIADWLERWGDGFDYMLVLDADSRMSVDRIRKLVARMEARPKLGLLQAAIGMTPGRTRFGRYQRTAARLLGPTFVRGFATWAGRSSNYWGHNALIRVEAFRVAAQLPVLSGPPPFGGSILSHDFVEAAWMRRAGWHVELDVARGGSAEGVPQTLEEFHKRDRRWCQGNLQHLRLLTEPGLHPLSRFHMASGVISYLAAPIWLSLLIISSSESVAAPGLAPVGLVVLLLLTPKLCGVIDNLRRPMTPWRRGVILRASAGELLLSAIVAPIMMVRQSGAVLSVLAGRDCGWKSRSKARPLPRGSIEVMWGLALAVIALAAGPVAMLWLAPIVMSLLGAPLLVRWLEA